MAPRVAGPAAMEARAAGAAGAVRGGGGRASNNTAQPPGPKPKRQRRSPDEIVDLMDALRDLVSNSAAQSAKASADAHAANAQEVYFTMCALEKVGEPVPQGVRQDILDRLHAALRRSVPLFGGDNDGRGLVTSLSTPRGRIRSARGSGGSSSSGGRRGVPRYHDDDDDGGGGRSGGGEAGRRGGGGGGRRGVPRYDDDDDGNDNDDRGGGGRSGDGEAGRRGGSGDGEALQDCT